MAKKNQSIGMLWNTKQVKNAFILILLMIHSEFDKSP